MQRSTPSLVLLPGMDGTGDLFRPLLGEIPPAWPSRVVRYPTDVPLSYDELLPVIEDDPGVVEGVALVAESFSGPLALRVAARRPEQVRAVVLVATFVRPPAPQWVRHLAVSALFRMPPPAALLRRLMLGHGAADALVREVAKSIARVRPEVLARRVKDVLAVDCTEELRRCRAPVLYLAAADDALVRPRSLAAIRAIRPDVHVSVVPGPHLLLQSRPHASWNEIERFLLGIDA